MKETHEEATRKKNYLKNSYMTDRKACKMTQQTSKQTNKTEITLHVVPHKSRVDGIFSGPAGPIELLQASV